MDDRKFVRESKDDWKSTCTALVISSTIINIILSSSSTFVVATFQYDAMMKKVRKYHVNHFLMPLRANDWKWTLSSFFVFTQQSLTVSANFYWKISWNICNIARFTFAFCNILRKSKKKLFYDSQDQQAKN